MTNANMLKTQNGLMKEHKVVEGANGASRRSFWRGKKVFITGHTGFKGSWLSLWLQSLGADVVGYALAPPTKPNLFTCARVAEGMTSIAGDVRDLDQLQRALREHEPQMVFHLAAQSLVERAYRDPVETYSTNVMGTVNLLEAVRCSGSARAVVTVTSDKCYKNKEWVWGYRETDDLGGHDPYSSSKSCAEFVASTYRRSFFASNGEVATASARAGNVIGGGDWAPGRLIPDIAHAFAERQPVEIRSLRGVRPWQHVLAPLDGYLSLAEKLLEHGMPFAESWNFGPKPGEDKPVAWIVDRMQALWGDGARWQRSSEAYPPEDTYLRLDCSKAENRLGWTSKLSLGETLAWIVEWYKTFYQETEDMRRLTEAQIARYEELVNANSEHQVEA